MTHNFFRKSKCIGSWLHRFLIVEEYESGVKEVCELCHKTRFFKILDDKVDNLRYMDFHIRNAIQPNHPYYYHEFEFNPLNEQLSPYV